MEANENRDIQSDEAVYVSALWHLDFHHGSLKVISPSKTSELGIGPRTQTQTHRELFFTWWIC
jgi:hypothetical protein